MINDREEALASLSFPLSFSYDFIHLIWSNLIVILIHLWTAEFKGLDHDDQDYVQMPMIWQAIGEVTYNAGKQFRQHSAPGFPI